MASGSGGLMSLLLNATACAKPSSGTALTALGACWGAPAGAASPTW
jgi:hypothetical protein